MLRLFDFGMRCHTGSEDDVTERATRPSSVPRTGGPPRAPPADGQGVGAVHEDVLAGLGLDEDAYSAGRLPDYTRGAPRTFS